MKAFAQGDKLQNVDQQNLNEKQIKRQKILRRYISASIVALILIVVISYFNGLFDGGDFSSATVKAKWALLKLFDIFGIVGLIYVFVAGLVFCSRHGAYDIFAFGFRQTLGHFFLSAADRAKYKSFDDYKKAQEEKRPAFAYLLWIGLALLVLAVIFRLIAQCI